MSSRQHLCPASERVIVLCKWGYSSCDMSSSMWVMWWETKAKRWRLIACFFYLLVWLLFNITFSGSEDTGWYSGQQKEYNVRFVKTFMSAFESNRKTRSIIWMGTEFDHINNVWVFPKREFNQKKPGNLLPSLWPYNFSSKICWDFIWPFRFLTPW